MRISLSTYAIDLFSTNCVLVLTPPKKEKKQQQQKNKQYQYSSRKIRVPLGKPLMSEAVGGATLDNIYLLNLWSLCWFSKDSKTRTVNTDLTAAVSWLRTKRGAADLTEKDQLSHMTAKQSRDSGVRLYIFLIVIFNPFLRVQINSILYTQSVI